MKRLAPLVLLILTPLLVVGSVGMWAFGTVMRAAAVESAPGLVPEETEEGDAEITLMSPASSSAGRAFRNGRPAARHLSAHASRPLSLVADLRRELPVDLSPKPRLRPRFIRLLN